VSLKEGKANTGGVAFVVVVFFLPPINQQANVFF